MHAASDEHAYTHRHTHTAETRQIKIQTHNTKLIEMCGKGLRPSHEQMISFWDFRDWRARPTLLGTKRIDEKEVATAFQLLEYVERCTDNRQKDWLKKKRSVWKKRRQREPHTSHTSNDKYICNFSDAVRFVFRKINEKKFFFFL